MTQPMIIGGGIGGLTLALALQRRGVTPTIYEAAAAFQPLGAGIIVPPNAMEVMARLGIAAELVQAGRPIRAAQVVDYRTGPLQRMATTLTPTGAFPAVAIHRARLQQILLEAVGAKQIHLGKACVAVAQDAAGVRASFADGTQAQADCLIAADGLHSIVRRELFPAARRRYSGQSSYRAVIAFDLPSDFDQAGWELWGPSCRFGFAAIAPGEVYWYATFDAPAAERDDPASRQARLAALFAAFPAPVPSLIAATDPDRVLRTDLSDCAPFAGWHRGRICLLGDAAHATTPNLGQGGAQAIEDGYVLARCLTEQPSAALAFAAYERQRIARTTMVVRRSWQLGQVAHWRHPLACALRNGLLRRVPASLAARQARELYHLPY